MPNVVSSYRLTAGAALAGVQAAVNASETLGVKVAVSIVDAGGHLLAFWKADGAFLPSTQISQDKAYTSAGFYMSSGGLYDAIKAEADVLIGIANQARIAAFPGGLPIVYEGEVVGGIGVSGASAEQDQLCAQAGIEAMDL